jgi:hypothetical protein
MSASSFSVKLITTEKLVLLGSKAKEHKFGSGTGLGNLPALGQLKGTEKQYEP